jgi:transcriptional regulator with XRE-family HTH domain
MARTIRSYPSSAATALRDRRKGAGLRVSEVAALASLSTASLSLIERGLRPLTPRRHRQIQAALELLEARRDTAGAGALRSNPLGSPSSRSPR